MIFKMKSMGYNFFVPLVMFLFFVSFILILPTGALEFQLPISMQILFVPLSAWWSVFLVYEIYDLEAEEILARLYPKKILSYYSLLTLIFLVLGWVLIILLNLRLPSFTALEFLILFSGQVILLSSLGLFFAILFKSVEVSFLVISMYVATEMMTGGAYMPWPHIFSFDLTLGMSEVVVGAILSLIASAFFLGIAVSFLGTVERKFF